jgi:hypothetical protein
MRIARECEKVVKVIESCETEDQFDTALQMAYCFSNKYEIRDKKNEHLTPYADVINASIDEKEEELECESEEKEKEPKIGFLR